MYIEHITSPADIKPMGMDKLEILCDEIRQAILTKLSKFGGHVGPNLGVVELTVAMHYVFNSPVDQIVFDVSHQSYTHKMLTGRYHSFMDGTISGYTNQYESPHDHFIIGHTSTAASLACGLAKARDILKQNHYVIAIIGDGALSGGEAFEGLDNIAEQGSQLIVVINDNDTSIAENHGGLYKNLKELRETKGQASTNYFKSLGLDYHYVDDGNDLEQMITAFQVVKTATRPIVLHVHTKKGKGYAPAESDEEDFHWHIPFDIATGLSQPSSHKSYSELTGEYLLNKITEHSELVIVNAATPGVIGFDPEQRKQAGKQFVDVGIAEEHAVAFCSAIASKGAKPILAIYSTFMQRTYDQLSHDLCLNDNPAVILVFEGGVHGINDATHLGFFDIALTINIPNMVYLAPTGRHEYFNMLDWAINQSSHPTIIRVPSTKVQDYLETLELDYHHPNRYQVTQQGDTVAIIAAGTFYSLGQKVSDQLKTQGITPTLINPRFLSGIDEKLLTDLTKNHQLVITLEDGIVSGGFGEKIAGFYGPTTMKTINFGLPKAYPDRYHVGEYMKSIGLTPEQIVDKINKTLK